MPSRTTTRKNITAQKEGKKTAGNATTGKRKPGRPRKNSRSPPGTPEGTTQSGRKAKGPTRGAAKPDAFQEAQEARKAEAEKQAEHEKVFLENSVWGRPQEAEDKKEKGSWGNLILLGLLFAFLYYVNFI